MPIRPDDVSGEFPEGSIQLTTRMLPPECDGDVPSVEIEGDARSLEYLGKLILAQAAFDMDCGYGISPKGGGSAFFGGAAGVGIYIHRLPCMDEEIDE